LSTWGSGDEHQSFSWAGPHSLKSNAFPEKKMALSPEGKLAIDWGLEVGKRAAVCAATIAQFSEHPQSQCRDLKPLWGKEKPRHVSSAQLHAMQSRYV
jgi:hypothetical protein